jgi:hypothetical protein
MVGRVSAICCDVEWGVGMEQRLSYRTKVPGMNLLMLNSTLSVTVRISCPPIPELRDCGWLVILGVLKPKPPHLQPFYIPVMQTNQNQISTFQRVPPQKVLWTYFCGTTLWNVEWPITR